MNSVNGYYTVNNQRYDNKITALIRASELKTDVKWHYFDNIFDNAKDKSSILADADLETAYKIRAQQAWEYHWKSYLDSIDISKMRSKDTVPVLRSKHYNLA